MMQSNSSTIQEDQRLGAARTMTRMPRGLAVRFDGRWAIIEDLATTVAPRLRNIGAPGLWKWVYDAGGPRRVFEIPAWCVSLTTDGDREELDLSGPLPLSRYVEWAAATREGAVPGTWQLPSKDLVQSWIRPGNLTVQARGCLRQIEMVLEERCWALRMALVPIQAELPEARHRALEILAGNVEDHMAMVRVGISGSQTPMLVAEVCLTGAPASELLFSAGLDALRHVAGLIETAEALSDVSIRIACLADAEITTKPRKETNVNIGAE